MKLNGDFIKSFWKYTSEQEDEMLQKARDERMRDEGMAAGEAKGRAEGKAEGMAEGKKAGILQTAKNMLKENCDIGLISKVTNLSSSEIKALM